MMSHWCTDDVVVNGVRLHYHRTGGGKPPLVLLHGATDNGLCWMRAAQALQDAYDVIMVDARGHGLSEAPEAGYGPDDQAADVAGLVQALHLDRPVLIGHSMGAATGAAAAARWPDLARAIVLEDPPWRNDPRADAAAWAARDEQWRADMAARKAKSIEELMAICRAENPTWHELEVVAWAQSKRQLSLNFGSFATRLARTMPWRDLVRAIACPILLITADPEAGALVTPSVAREAATLWRQGRVVHIRGAGHNIRREQFDSYIAAVTGFLHEICKS